ncbi:MAG: nucleotidyltransferase family protein [Candidatus Wolfebacteria bacterium]|nr:nucleotidyltransferase family protein [Candidatus Wolfebacteria bacterium]
MEREQIREKLKSQKPFLRQRYHVKKMGIFGSVARNEANKKSDIDVLVEFNEPIGMFEFIRLEYFLKKILKRKVDLVTKKALKRAIKKDILKETIYV